MLSMYTPDSYRDYSFQTFSSGGFLLICGTIFIPVSIIYVLIKPIDTLNNRNFRNKWGIIYEAYNFQDRIKIMYKLFFCLRRIVFVGSIVIFDTIPSMQFLALLVVNLLMSEFIAKKPFKRNFTNRFEIMNEFMMASICYCAIVITDYFPSNVKKYKGAKTMI